jgi:hypothetical protein
VCGHPHEVRPVVVTLAPYTLFRPVRHGSLVIVPLEEIAGETKRKILERWPEGVTKPPEDCHLYYVADAHERALRN